MSWTKEEKEVLEEAYRTRTPLSTIDLFKNKSRQSIVGTARRMGLNVKYPDFDYMVGLQFGKLKVIKKLEKNPTGSNDYLYECVCNCGNQQHVIASGGHLRNGDTKSCGCIKNEIMKSRIDDLTGKRFGYLTVLKMDDERYISPSGHQHIKWICKCDCGKTVSVNVSSLRCGTKSCGCKRIELAKQNRPRSNMYDLTGKYGIGYDKCGKEFYFDIEDYDKIKKYNWFCTEHEYVRTRLENGKLILMHRLIMDVLESPNIYIDHIHMERKNDNRKSNLRLSTRSQNGMNIPVRSNNSSGATGISWAKNVNKWHTYISKDGKRDNLGWFDDFEEAVAARKAAEEKYFGECSYDNSQAVDIGLVG